MIDINNLTIGQIKEIAAMVKCENPITNSAETSLTIGVQYFIRTVTHYFTGRLVAVNRNEFVLEDAAWIADTRLFSTFLKDGISNECEIEPFEKAVIVNRAAIIDITEWIHPLPRTQQ